MSGRVSVNSDLSILDKWVFSAFRQASADPYDGTLKTHFSLGSRPRMRVLQGNGLCFLPVQKVEKSSSNYEWIVGGQFWKAAVVSGNQLQKSSLSRIVCAAFLRQVKILLAYLSMADGLRINKSFPAVFFFPGERNGKAENPLPTSAAAWAWSRRDGPSDDKRQQRWFRDFVDRPLSLPQRQHAVTWGRY